MQSKKISKRKIFSILVFLGLSLILSIRFGKGGLKAVGILDSDFIISTTGGLYDTANHTLFKSTIGDSTNNNIAKVNHKISDSFFSLTLLNESQQETAQSTDSSSLAAELDLLQQSLEKSEQQVASIVGQTNQSYFGPFESIRQNSILGGYLDYYINKNELIEEWTINDNIESIKFSYLSPQIVLTIDDKQNWILSQNDKIVATISTKFFSKNNQEYSTSPQETKTIGTSQNGTTIELNIPQDLKQNYSQNFPIKIVRTLTLTSPDQNTKSVDYGSIFPSSPHPKFLNKFSDYLIYFDQAEKKVYKSTPNSQTVIFTDIEVMSLSCNQIFCALSTGPEIWKFNPNELPENDSNIQKKLISDPPAAGLFVKDQSLYRTSFSSPVGGIYLDDAQVLSNLSQPQMLSVNPSQEVIFLADGQVNKYKNDSLEKINLPYTPKDLRSGPLNDIYFISYFDKIKSNIVGKISPSQNFEILSKVSGDLTSILPTSQGLYIARPNLIQYLSNEEITWISITEFE